MTVRCDFCGSVSDLDETFLKSRNSFRLKKWTYCPQCWSERALASDKSWLWIVGLFLFIIVILWFFDSKKASDFFFIFLFVVFLSALIVPHELGHAIIAHCLGMRVFIIIIGSGKTLKELRFLGFRWEIKQYPLYGLTVNCAKSAQFFRLKRFIITLAGPAVNLGLLLITLYAYRSFTIFKSMSIPFAPFGCFAFANIWMLLFNLAPHNFKTAYGKVKSDGLSLLTVPFSSKTDIHRNITFYYALEGLELRKNGQLSQAAVWYEKYLSSFPEDTTILNDYGLVLMDLGRLAEAKEIYKQIIQMQASDVHVKAITLNNLAYVDILLGEKSLLEEADAASSQAFGSYPWIPAVKGTRAMVLVDLGQLDEGIRLLQDALEKTEELQGKAANAAYLAIAKSRKGDKLRAQQYLDIAKQFDADCRLLKRAQEEISR